MSMQEEIADYKEAQEAERTERLAAQSLKQERIFGELLGVLDQLRVQEQLTQVRDELWGTGEVFARTDSGSCIDGNIVVGGSLYKAEIVLEARWGRFVAGHLVSHWYGDLERTDWVPPTVGEIIKSLSISATLREVDGKEEDEIEIRGLTELPSLTGNPSIMTIPRQSFEPKKVVESIEKRLIRDCIYRQERGCLPYIGQQAIDTAVIVEKIKSGELPAKCWPQE